MSRAFAWILVAAAAAAATAACAAQQPPGSGFVTSTTAVVVDVVVRDAKGAPILDLKPSDFELLEDDVKQRIASVELIAPGRTPAAGRAPAPPRRNATRRRATGSRGPRTPAAADQARR